MSALPKTVEHLMTHVLDAAKDYHTAEQALSSAQERGAYEAEATAAKRKAAELSIAIDGLSDRAAKELNQTIGQVSDKVKELCFLPGTNSLRVGAFARVWSIANAYKHGHLDKPSHVINDFGDVLVVAPGYGVDGYGVGKYGGVEVLVKDKDGKTWKFLGDAPAVVAGWFNYLQQSGAELPHESIIVCGMQVFP
jgi:hypothetical protein